MENPELLAELEPGFVDNDTGRTVIVEDAGKVLADMFTQNIPLRDALIFGTDVKLRASFLRGIFEHVNYYAELSGQHDALMKASWYEYARFMRVMGSHHLATKQIDWPNRLQTGGITEITWRNRTIRQGMVGDDLRISALEAFELHAEIVEYVEKNFV